MLLKEVIVASVIEYCNDEEHQHRCQEYDINTLVPQNVNVYELLSHLISGSPVLQIRFVVYVDGNLFREQTRREASLPVYPQETITSSNETTKRTAPMWASNFSLLEQCAYVNAQHPEGQRHVARRLTITGAVVMDAMEAHRQIITDRLQVDYQIEIVSENFKSHWEKMSIAAKCVAIIASVVVVAVCIVLNYMFDKIRK